MVTPVQCTRHSSYQCHHACCSAPSENSKGTFLDGTTLDVRGPRLGGARLEVATVLALWVITGEKEVLWVQFRLAKCWRYIDRKIAGSILRRKKGRSSISRDIIYIGVDGGFALMTTSCVCKRRPPLPRAQTQTYG